MLSAVIEAVIEFQQAKGEMGCSKKKVFSRKKGFRGI